MKLKIVFLGLMFKLCATALVAQSDSVFHELKGVTVTGFKEEQRLETSVEIISTSAENYSVDYPIVAGAAGHTEKWSFTVTNRDGLTNTVSFTLTVN